MLNVYYNNVIFSLFHIPVSPAWEEPLPGWVDSLNGPIGIMVGGAKGVIRSMLCDGKYRSEVIPVDIAINGLIAIGWKVGTMTEKYGYIYISYNLRPTFDIKFIGLIDRKIFLCIMSLAVTVKRKRGKKYLTRERKSPTNILSKRDFGIRTVILRHLKLFTP